MTKNPKINNKKDESGKSNVEPCKVCRRNDNTDKQATVSHLQCKNQIDCHSQSSKN